MKYPLILVALALSVLTACGGSSSSGPRDPVVANPDTASEQGGGGSAAASFGEPVLSQIRPGVLVDAAGSQCTSNFLFYLNDQTVYLGTAGHCFSLDVNNGVDPCESSNLAIGSAVNIENASQPGTVAYSSYRAMQEVGETPGSATCLYNDFALIQLHPSDIANIHPAVRSYGGPTSLATGLAAVGDTVYAFGQSPFHLGQEALQMRSGQITAVYGGGWFYEVFNDLLTPGIPGDSGGPVLDANGRALAVTSVITVSLSSVPVSNGVTNLDRALQYAKDNGFVSKSVKLMTWSDFNPLGGM